MVWRVGVIQHSRPAESESTCGKKDATRVKKQGSFLSGQRRCTRFAPMHDANLDWRTGVNKSGPRRYYSTQAELTTATLLREPAPIGPL